MKSNTQRWFKGLWSAFVGGGAGSVVSAGILGFADAKDYSPTDHPLACLKVAGIAFLLHGLYQLMTFLQQHPAPDDNTTFTPNPNPTNKP